MSIDLTIKSRQPSRYRDILEKTADNIRILLRLPNSLRVECQSRTDSMDYVGEDVFDDIIFLTDYPAHNIEFGVSLVPTTPGWEDPEQEGWWFTVTMRAAHQDPIKHILAIATAISLAELQAMPVLDESNYLKLGNDAYDSAYLTEQFTIANPQPTVMEALRAFGRTNQ